MFRQRSHNSMGFETPSNPYVYYFTFTPKG
jgi:hypothetical protein